MRNQPVKVAIWGFGAMGSGMARMLLTKKGFEIVGVCDTYDGFQGKSIHSLLGIDASHNQEVLIEKDIDTMLAKAKPEVVLLATDSFTKNAYPKIKLLVEHGCNVISTAEEMAYPMAAEPELSMAIDRLAKQHNVTVLGTGVNPGMMMDLLAVFLTGVMKDVGDVRISRVNSLSPFGKTVMEEQGVGLSVAEFQKKSAEGRIAGHVGFRESTRMIADALGLRLEGFQQSMAPIVTDIDRTSPYGFAKKGDVCGVDMKAFARFSEGHTITMHHPQQIEPALGGVQTGDHIVIEGSPSVHMTIAPEIEGGIGTIAICVNMIPHVLNAKPGLKTMLDLPVPRAIMGDVRAMLEEFS